MPDKDVEIISRCWEYVERTGDGLKDICTMIGEKNGLDNNTEQGRLAFYR